MWSKGHHSSRNISGMSGMGVDNGGAAMNTSVPHLDLFELLDLYDDIIMANNKRYTQYFLRGTVL